MDERASIGYWLRRRRKALDLTRDELARRVGCATVTLVKIEADERRPSLQIAQRLAQALLLDPEECGAFLKVMRGELWEGELALATQPVAAARVPGGQVPATNLPVQRERPIGRDDELAAVCALLARDEVALVTLSGPGGTGKTRLALQAASDLLNQFADGVWFVDLAPLSDASLVPSTVAGAMGVMETPGQPIVETLTSYLRTRQLLLVLDNFEHLLEAASLVAELLRAAPYIKLLVTSRSVLRLSSEQEFPVPPLAVPDTARLPPLETIGQYSAVRLFIHRAQAVRPEFQLTPDTAATVAAICARLDGLPLAIRLAAARVKHFPPQALLTRLEQRLKLLTGGPRDLPERQQTLRGAIDWSYHLLREEEQVLFARLAVFAGGCTLEAAEIVCMVEPAPTGEVVDGLASLIDNSLLRQGETSDGEARFSMLETIREYALERLETSGSAEVVRERHMLYFLTLAEKTDLASRDVGRIPSHLWHVLEAEHDNLRAALAWSDSREERAELTLRLAGALETFWIDRGLFQEGDSWLERALKHDDLSQHRSARARALLTAGALAWYRNAYERSRERSEEALACYRELGDRWGTAAACFCIGGGARLLGEYARAEMFLQESLSLYRELDHPWRLVWTLLILGLTLLDTGEARRAAPYVDEGLFVSRSTGNRLGIASALKLQATIASMQGDATRATGLLEQSLAVIRDTGETADSADVLIMLGHIARSQGDHCRAAQLYRESLELLRNTPEDKEWLVKCLEALAGVAVASAKGDSRRAPRLFGAAEGLRTAVNAPIPPVARADYQRDVAVARSQLDEGSWAAAWAEGSAMTLEQAIAYALEEVPDG